MKSEQLAWLIKRHGIEMTHLSHGSHIGSILSVADIVAVLYNDVANITPENVKDENRDRIVLSKGHAGAAIYAALAEKGFFPVEDIKTFRHTGSYLQGHPSLKDTPGVDMSTGSLGQGICTANGMALAAKLDNKDYRVYTILGDGELEEGQVWEAAMFASHYKLSNLCVIVDWNGLQIDGPIANVMNPTPHDKKFEAFGFNVISIDGHNFDEIENAFRAARECTDRPTAIIAKTVKGKGVSFMENQVGWHGKAPKAEEYEQAVAELNA